MHNDPVSISYKRCTACWCLSCQPPAMRNDPVGVSYKRCTGCRCVSHQPPAIHQHLHMTSCTSNIYGLLLPGPSVIDESSLMQEGSGSHGNRPASSCDSHQRSGRHVCILIRASALLTDPAIGETWNADMRSVDRLQCIRVHPASATEVWIADVNISTCTA